STCSTRPLMALETRTAPWRTMNISSPGSPSRKRSWFLRRRRSWRLSATAISSGSANRVKRRTSRRNLRRSAGGRPRRAPPPPGAPPRRRGRRGGCPRRPPGPRGGRPRAPRNAARPPARCAAASLPAPRGAPLRGPGEEADVPQESQEIGGRPHRSRPTRLGGHATEERVAELVPALTGGRLGEPRERLENRRALVGGELVVRQQGVRGSLQRDEEVRIDHRPAHQVPQP